MNYDWLDAMLNGAIAVLVLLVPCLLLFWRLTRGLPGPRPQRPFVAACAAYGIATGGAGLWAAGFERYGFMDEAINSAMVAGAVAALVAFLILMLLPRRA